MTVEIEKGTVFRTLKAETVDGVQFLQVNDKYESGWFIDTGVAGEWRGKKLIERVPAYMLRDVNDFHIEDYMLNRKDIAPSSLFYVPDFIDTGVAGEWRGKKLIE